MVYVMEIIKKIHNLNKVSNLRVDDKGSPQIGFLEKILSQSGRPLSQYVDTQN